MSNNATMKTTQLLAKLRTMANDAGSALFDRAKMAKEVLDDLGWIAEATNGDYDKAADIVEKDCFPELSMSFSIHDLLTLLVTFPEKHQWQAAKWNLNLLWAKYEESKVKGEKGERSERARATVKMIQERDDQIKDLEFQVKRFAKNEETWESERSHYREKIETLQLDNARLKGRIEQLEAIVDRMRKPAMV